MRRVAIAFGENRHLNEYELAQGSFLWPPDVTWAEFLRRNRDAIPVDRIVMARRRQYDREMRTALVLSAHDRADTVFPRESYVKPLVIEILLKPDQRIESLLKRLDVCKTKLDRLDRRLDTIQEWMDARHVE